MISENRHHTKKWNERRKKKLADKCGKPQCTICHSNKVIGIPTRQQMRADCDEQILGEEAVSLSYIEYKNYLSCMYEREKVEEILWE